MADRLAREVRAARAVAGLTQCEVARRARISQSMVAQVESGRATPRMDVLRRLAVATGHDLSIRLYPGGGVRLRDSGQLASAEWIRTEANPRWRVSFVGFGPVSVRVRRLAATGCCGFGPAIACRHRAPGIVTSNLVDARDRFGASPRFLSNRTDHLSRQHPFQVTTSNCAHVERLARAQRPGCRTSPRRGPTARGWSTRSPHRPRWSRRQERVARRCRAGAGA